MTPRDRAQTSERTGPPILARSDPALSARVVEVFTLKSPSRVRAGSGLLAIGERLLAIQDDAFEVIWIDPKTHSQERVALAGRGEPLPKPQKPDFEAALLGPSETVYILGSGSLPNRRFIARLSLTTTERTLIDATPLYEAIEYELGCVPNIEGAVLLGDVLRLFHRGSERIPFANASLDVPREALDGTSPKVLATTRYDLGRIGTIPLTFTDAAKYTGNSILYLAVAEDTEDAILDGPIAGGALGILSEGDARFTRLLGPNGEPFAGKAEGLALNPDARSAFLITDPDSPDEPAELCRIRLDGPWSL